MTRAAGPTILDATTTLALDLNGVKLIEASAGTGKTYTIANLYLRHILLGRSPAEILVVTFTNAATEELRGRIRARLYDSLRLLEQAAPGQDEFLNRILERWQDRDTETRRLELERLRLALRSMDEAAIFTIHGFCQRALSDHALASGQAFDVDLMQDDSPLWDECIKDWWRRQSYSLAAADWQLFRASLGSLASFQALQLGLKDHSRAQILPDEARSLDSLYLDWRRLESTLGELASAWQTEKTQIIEALEDSKALSRGNKLPYHKDNLAGAIEQWESCFTSPDSLMVPDSLAFLGSDALWENSKPSQRGKDPRLEGGFFAQTQSLLDRIAEIRFAFRIRALIEARDFARQQVRAIKRQDRKLSYADQLSLLFEALQGDGGERLAETLRERYPVAMIDEFQDTDAIQYGIFKKLYFTDADASLTMIGDPKQAIYSFRGGDIFTYIKAKQAPGVRHYSLVTNWRSEPGLVQAVNSLFGSRSDPFVFGDAIDYRAITAAENKTPTPLSIDAAEAALLSIWQIPRAADGKNHSARTVYRLINDAIADEILRLIPGDGEASARLGDQPLRSGDIAILVRTAREGNDLRSVFAARGIRAVSIGKDKVFDSDEAGGLYDLLTAINRYSDRDSLRAALASPLLNLDYRRIAELCDDEDNWRQWSEKIHQLHLTWAQRGFIAMFQQLLQKLEVAETIAESDFAERRLTNLLHLAELAQQQSRLSPGFDALLAWYRAQIDEAATEETELRLENDENLVKIVTIHKSKGLEYPVVFAPFLWNCRPRSVNAESMLLFHDADHDPVIDLGSERHAQHALIAEKERLAEDIRLAYVAITRARARVYLAWGDVGDGKMPGRPPRTALGYLLHPRQSAAELDTKHPWAFDIDEFSITDLDRIIEKAAGSIELLPLPTETVAGGSEPPPALASLESASFERHLANDWQIASFTGLTREVHQVAHGGSGGLSGDPILDFPAGSRVGLLLHSLLEHLDFEGDIAAQCETLLPRFSGQYDLDSSEQRKTLSLWLETLVASPFDDSGLRLSSLPAGQRLNELSFDFSIDHLSVDALNRLLARVSGAELTPLSLADFRGMITGVIDLVFEHHGKYYLADYKSNHLGASLDDYSADKLERAILDRRYDLQYLIYSIALHRYLARRLPDYDYERHFGGVYYLFIRAMRPDSAGSRGVYFKRPEIGDIHALDHLFGSAPQNETAA